MNVDPPDSDRVRTRDPQTDEDDSRRVGKRQRTVTVQVTRILAQQNEPVEEKQPVGLVNRTKRYYYWTTRNPANPQYHDEALTELERGFLDDFDLWRPSLSVWLQQSSQRIRDQATREQHQSLDDWRNRAYIAIGKACANGTLREEFPVFVSLWTSVALVLPRDAVLLEGHEGYRPCKVGDVVVRARPSSTSWQVRSALTYTAGALSTLYIHHFPTETVRALNVQSETGFMWHDCEVVLQPGIRVQVDRIIDRYTFGFTDPHARAFQLVFTTVTPLQERAVSMNE